MTLKLAFPVVHLCFSLGLIFVCFMTHTCSFSINAHITVSIFREESLSAEVHSISWIAAACWEMHKGSGLLKNVLQLRAWRNSCKTCYLGWSRLLRHRGERCHFSQNLLRFLSFLPVCLGQHADLSTLHPSDDVYRHLPHSACLAVIQPSAISPQQLSAWFFLIIKKKKQN